MTNTWMENKKSIVHLTNDKTLLTKHGSKITRKLTYKIIFIIKIKSDITFFKIMIIYYINNYIK